MSAFTCCLTAKEVLEKQYALYQARSWGARQKLVSYQPRHVYVAEMSDQALLEELAYWASCGFKAGSQRCVSTNH